jgi:hypothetical protein
VGTKSGTAGATLSVQKAKIRPYRFVDTAETKDLLVAYCKTLFGFRGLLDADIRLWLTPQPDEDRQQGIATNQDVDIHITLVSLPTNIASSIFSSVSAVPQLMDELLTGVGGLYIVPQTTETTTTSVRSYPLFLHRFPLGPAQRANTANHSLVLRKAFWRLQTLLEARPEYVESLQDLQVRSSYELLIDGLNGTVIRLQPETLDIPGTIYVPCRSGKNLWLLAVPRPNGTPEPLSPQPWHRYIPTSQGGRKSLLQKLIRFQAKMVQIDDVLGGGPPLLVSTTQVLRYTCIAMARARGSFVPDIQRFVTGLETLKRLVIIGFEDAHITDDMEPTAVCICAVALASRQMRSYCPPDVWIEEHVVRFATRLLETDKAFVYTTEHLYPLHTNTVIAWERVSMLLDDLRAFQSDLRMVRDIIQTQRTQTISHSTDRPAIMHLSHYIDQHCAPWVTRFIPQDQLPLPSEPSKPFGQALHALFRDVTGKNPRRTGTEITDWCIAVQRAQRLAWLSSLPGIPCVVDVPFVGTTSMPITLPMGWIMGAIGHIPVREGTSKYFVLVTDVDPVPVFQVVYQPSRTDRKESHIEENIQDRIIDRVKQQMRTHGVPLSGGQPTFRNRRAYLGPEGHLHLAPSANRLTPANRWIQVRNQQHVVSTFRAISPDVFDTVPLHLQLETSIRRTCAGVAANWEPLLRELLYRLPDPVLRRLHRLVILFPSRITFADISRDGGANQDVLPCFLDPATCLFLCRLCIICPGILVPFPSKGFIVHDKSGLRYIVQHLIVPALADRVSRTPRTTSAWPMRPDLRERTQVQEESLGLLQRRFAQGRTSFGLFSNTGSGKTKMVVDALYAWQSVLPEYLIWCVPPGVLKTAYQELSRCFDTIHFWVPKANNTAAKNALHDYRGKIVGGTCPLPQQHTVLLLHHDQLKKGLDRLEPYMSSATFVFDEVHNALNPKTQRTSAALRLVSQAAYSFILSATPARNNHVFEIGRWLEMQVPYTVTPKNVLTAMGSAFSDRHETGIEIVRETSYTLHVDGEVGDLIAHMRTMWGLVEQEYLRYLPSDLARGKRVLLVVADLPMAQRLYTAVAQLVTKDVVLVPATGIHITPQTVATGSTLNYQVAITTCTRVEGYSLTTFDTMYTSVFYGNAFKRRQLEGRLDRIGSEQSRLTFRTFIIGALMQRMSDRQARGDSFLQALVSIERQMKDNR